MAMAVFKDGKPVMQGGLPASNMNAGDVLVVNNYPMVAHAANPTTTVGVSGPGIDGLALKGGVYQMAADAAYIVGTYVYWNPTAQQVTTGPAGTVPFGFIVAGPTGLYSDGGAAGAGSPCWVLHDPAAIGTGFTFNLGATASDVITNTSSTTNFVTTAVIPAATLETGDIITIKSTAVVLGQSPNTTTQEFLLRLNTAANTYNVVFNSGAVNVAANGVGYIDVDLIFNAVGASGGFTAVGLGGLANTAAPTLLYVSNTAINTNSAITVSAAGLANAANTGQNFQLLELNVTLKRK